MSLIQDSEALKAFLASLVTNGKWETGSDWLNSHLYRTPDGDVSPFEEKGEPLSLGDVEGVANKRYNLDDPGLATLFGSIHYWGERKVVHRKKGSLTIFTWIGSKESLDIAEVLAQQAEEFSLKMRYINMQASVPMMSEKAKDVSSGRFRQSAEEKLDDIMEKVGQDEGEKVEEEEIEEEEVKEKKKKPHTPEIKEAMENQRESFPMPIFTLLLWNLTGKDVDDIPF